MSELATSLSSGLLREALFIGEFTGVTTGGVGRHASFTKTAPADSPLPWRGAHVVGAHLGPSRFAVEIA